HLPRPFPKGLSPLPPSFARLLALSYCATRAEPGSRRGSGLVPIDGKVGPGRAQWRGTSPFPPPNSLKGPNALRHAGRKERGYEVRPPTGGPVLQLRCARPRLSARTGVGQLATLQRRQDRRGIAWETIHASLGAVSPFRRIEEKSECRPG